MVKIPLNLGFSQGLLLNPGYVPSSYTGLCWKMALHSSQPPPPAWDFLGERVCVNKPTQGLKAVPFLVVLAVVLLGREVYRDLGSSRGWTGLGLHQAGVSVEER